MIGNISYRCMLLKRYILFVVKQTNNLQWGWPDLKKNKVHCAFAFCPNWYEILTLCLQFQIDSSSGLYADFRTSSFHRTWFGLSPSSYVIIMMHKYHDACRFHIICRCNVGYIKVCSTWNSWRHRKHNRFWQAIRQKIIPEQSDHQAIVQYTNMLLWWNQWDFYVYNNSMALSKYGHKQKLITSYNYREEEFYVFHLSVWCIGRVSLSSEETIEVSNCAIKPRRYKGK